MKRLQILLVSSFAFSSYAQSGTVFEAESGFRGDLKTDVFQKVFQKNLEDMRKLIAEAGYKDEAEGLKTMTDFVAFFKKYPEFDIFNAQNLVHQVLTNSTNLNNTLARLKAPNNSATKAIISVLGLPQISSLNVIQVPLSYYSTGDTTLSTPIVFYSRLISVLGGIEGYSFVPSYSYKPKGPEFIYGKTLPLAYKVEESEFSAKSQVSSYILCNYVKDKKNVSAWALNPSNNKYLTAQGRWGSDSKLPSAFATIDNPMMHLMGCAKALREQIKAKVNPLLIQMSAGNLKVTATNPVVYYIKNNSEKKFQRVDLIQD